MEEGEVVYLLVVVHLLFEDEQIILASLDRDKLVEKQQDMDFLDYVKETRIDEVPLI